MENASPNEPGGFFSIGTDAVYCINPNCGQCLPGTFIGLRRLVDPNRWPLTCSQGSNFIPLELSYGDPDNPGPTPPDMSLSDLVTVWDIYGDGAFADGLTGTHLWLRLVDCEDDDQQEITVTAPLMKRYKQTLAAFLDGAKNYCSRRGMVYLSASSDTSVEDLVLGYLWPWTISDAHLVEFTLEPLLEFSEEEKDAMIERLESTRARLQPSRE